MKNSTYAIFCALVVAGYGVVLAQGNYSRSAFRHWIDVDGDCQNTRAEVLIRDSQVEVRLSDDGCRVLDGSWFDPYTGETVKDAARLDVDHLVPLKEAWISGAHAWTDERRQLYANDLVGDPWHLIPVKLGANRSKGAKDPAKWKPPAEASWCSYAARWYEVKLRWGLEVDRDEMVALVEMLGTCKGAGRTP